MKPIKHALLIVILAVISISHTYAQTSVWKISKNNDYFYLGGTIHLLNKEDYPLPAEFNAAYQDADTLVFETDIDSGNQPDEQAKMIAAMSYSDERTIASELTPVTYKALEDFLLSRQIPISHFKKYQPWGLSIIITVMEYQRLGMVSALGVDNYFNEKAKADKKTTLSLETLDQQLGFLQSLAQIDPNETIEYTLKDVETLPQWIQTMKMAWRKGDIEAFTQMGPVKDMKTQFPKVYHALIINRNNNWMKQLPTLMNNHKKEFILVGALHLNGEKGLLNQLKKQGFTVKHL